MVASCTNLFWRITPTVRMIAGSLAMTAYFNARMATHAVSAKTVKAKRHEPTQKIEAQPVLGNSIKPGTTPQVHSLQSVVALQAQK